MSRANFRPEGFTARNLQPLPPPPTRSASNSQRMAGESVALRRQESPRQDSQALSFEDQEIRRMDRERAVQERRDRERAALRRQESPRQDSQALSFEDQEIRRMDRERAVQERRDRERARLRREEAAGNEQYLYFD